MTVSVYVAPPIVNGGVLWKRSLRHVALVQSVGRLEVSRASGQSHDSYWLNSKRWAYYRDRSQLTGIVVQQRQP